MNARFIILALLLAAGLAGPAYAQKEPAEVTDGEISKYKALAQSACRQAGEKQGDPKEKVEAFCACVISTLEKSMTRPEWQQAYFHSLKGQSGQEKEVLDPHLKKVAECRPTAPGTAEPQSQPQSQLQPPPQPQDKPRLKVR